MTRSLRTPARIGVVAVLMAVLSLVLAGNPASSPASAATGPVTVSGHGAFPSLKVTVDQTDNLVNQVVHVSWSGGVPTSGQANFLSIMQCWGDDPSGPSREQCQFGGFENQLGGWASTRQVYYGGAVSDTHETYLPPAGSGLPVYVPFRPVDNDPEVPRGNTNQFYDANTTNEVAKGVTYADGTGESFFQMQTAREAPGLGCGAEVDDITTATVEKARHSCWLVVVPRGGDELAGITTSSSGGVVTSPLSVTNWDQRIVIPLQFQSIGSTCPLGSAEVPTYGTELVTDAIGSWQPALCSQTSTVYSFTQVPDDLARTTTSSSDPTKSGLGIVGRSIPTDQVGGAHLAYAPVAVSAIGFGFLVERSSIFGATTAVRQLDGRRLEGLKLTPRLVAKILTQSYAGGAPAQNPRLEQRVKVAGRTTTLIESTVPASLGTDPEFVRLNPDLASISTTMSDALVPYIPADSVSLLWQWVNSDKAARDFLDGKPNFDSPWFSDCGQSANATRCLGPIDCTKFTDAKGVNGCPTYVNPSYKGIGLPQSVIPKQDNWCLTRDLLPPLCTLDLTPYANGLTDTANAASRGDSLSRTIYNGISYSKGPVQAPGARNLMALTDTASAARFALTMASLRNGAGEFVQPTNASMSKAVSAMKPDASGVLVPDPTTKTAGAYPLTTVSYAVVNRDALTAVSRAAYADFVTFAATSGQVPGTTRGTLPEGYLPLTASLKRAALSAAVEISTPVPAPPPVPTQSPTPVPTTPTDQSGGTGTQPLPTTSDTGGASPTPGPTSTTSAAPTSSPATRTVALTQPITAGPGAAGLLAALVLGATAAVGAAVALRFASRGGS